MSTPCPRPTRPLNKTAMAAADDALYAAHEKDARPNALFDSAGKKQRLSATDPQQECLRDERVEHYSRNGGKVENPAGENSKRPGEAVQKCPCEKASLSVSVRYNPLDAPIDGATVTIRGPVTKSAKTDSSGKADFTGLPPGQYQVSTRYEKKNALVELAQSNVGNTDWAVASARKPYPAGKNKCNLFVYEMLTDAGYSVPQQPHVKLYGLGETVYLPPVAKDWSNPAKSIGSSSAVSLPEPGDVIAWSHDYWDASGHVGIVSYPKPDSPKSKELQPGEQGQIGMTMQRQSVSAGSTDIIEDTYHFWHYYAEHNQDEIGKILFRRMTK